MITSMLARRWLQNTRKQPDDQHRRARKGFTRALYGAAAAGLACTTAGVVSAAAPATAATQSLRPPVYTTGEAGYTSYWRWFRFVSTTLTVPPRTVPAGYGGGARILLYNSAHGPVAAIGVRPGGGPGSVMWWAPGQPGDGTFQMSPQIGDQLKVSIYYDRHGHTYLTASDTTQGATGTARAQTGDVVYNKVLLSVGYVGTPPQPATDTRAWKFADTHLTTYTGVHGTVVGPWETSKLIGTTTGTSTGTVVTSPSGLWNSGQNFGVWLRHQ
jgi:hypothetical protein